MLTSSRQDAALVETVYSSWPLSSGCHNPFTKWCLLALCLKRSSRIWQKAGYFQLENVASICSQLPPCIGAVTGVIHKSAPTEKSFSFLKHFLFYILNLTKSAIPTAVWEAQPSLTRQRGSLLINKSSLNSLEVLQCHTPQGHSTAEWTRPNQVWLPYTPAQLSITNPVSLSTSSRPSCSPHLPTHTLFHSVKSTFAHHISQASKRKKCRCDCFTGLCIGPRRDPELLALLSALTFPWCIPDSCSAV